jgi:hypothetical protein
MNSRAPDLFDAVYTTDGVGRTLTGRFRACSTPCTHILAIDRDGLVASFAYQDVHYFLTESRGQHAAAPAHRAGSGRRRRRGGPQL